MKYFIFSWKPFTLLMKNFTTQNSTCLQFPLHGGYASLHAVRTAVIRIYNRPCVLWRLRTTEGRGGLSLIRGLGGPATDMSNARQDVRARPRVNSRMALAGRELGVSWA